MFELKDLPMIWLSHFDEAERCAYRIADNKLAALGEWDEALLRDEMAGLLTIIPRCSLRAGCPARWSTSQTM